MRSLPLLLIAVSGRLRRRSECAVVRWRVAMPCDLVILDWVAKPWSMVLVVCYLHVPRLAW